MASSTSFPNTGITSIHQPGPSFFRGRQPRRFSNSSLSSNESDEGSDHDDSSSSSSSSSASSRSSFSHSNSTKASNPPSGSKAPIKRQHLKLSLAYVRTRQALRAPYHWDSLASALKGLSTAIPADLSALGVCIPILARLGSDLMELLGGDDMELGKGYRKGLGKDDAKALVGLRQRWSGVVASSGGKGKGKVTENDWYPAVLAMVSKVDIFLYFRRRALIHRTRRIPLYYGCRSPTVLLLPRFYTGSNLYYFLPLFLASISPKRI